MATKYSGIVLLPARRRSADRDLARRDLEADPSALSSSIESFLRGDPVCRLKRRGTDVVEAALCDSRGGLCGVVGTSAVGLPGRESGRSGRLTSDPTPIGDVGRVSGRPGRSLSDPVSMGDAGRVTGSMGRSLIDPISIGDEGRVSGKAGMS